MSREVIMRFYGHDIEGDAATLARINNELTQRDALLAVLCDIEAHIRSGCTYGNGQTLRERMHAAIAEASEKCSVQFAMRGSDTFGPVSRGFAALVIKQWRAKHLRVTITRRDAARAYMCFGLDECVRVGCAP